MQNISKVSAAEIGWNRKLNLTRCQPHWLGKKCFLELCFCHQAFRKLLVVLLKSQTLVSHSKIQSTKAVVQSMEGLKTVILDAGSDRDIWEDFGVLLLIQTFLTSRALAVKMLECVAPLLPCSVLKAYTAMLVHPSVVWEFLTVLVLPLVLTVILTKGWCNVL